MSSPNHELVDAIAAALTADGQYRELATSTERVDLVRRCGRAAGRRESLPVRTFATQLDDAGATEVWVVNTKPVNPDDELAHSDDSANGSDPL